MGTRTSGAGRGKRQTAGVKGGRRQARSDARQAIMDAARAILAEQGYEGLTIDRVMERADLSRTIFYRHFGDRGGLLIELWGEFVEALTESADAWLGGDPKADLEESLRANIAVFAAQAPVFIAVCDESPSDPEVRAAYEGAFWGFVEAVEARIRALHPDIPNPAGMAEILVTIDERLWYRRFRESTAPAVVEETLTDTIAAWTAILGQ